ncbi:MAG: dihydrolipoyl dehydrogenase [Alphaproteobacteria bacterium]|nr:dihydrolipoyl dehydrogenase [Alphaproteobacteria bacterium]
MHDQALEKSYDVAIIGGGPGGYVAAIRAAQLGKKVVCIDKRGKLGGTCLNVGCIPSKAMLHISSQYEGLRHHLPVFGIEAQGATINLSTMMEYKTKMVDDLTKGIEGLFRKHKIAFVVGEAQFQATNELAVKTSNGVEVIKAKHIIIATGSESAMVPGIEIDERDVVSSTGALAFERLPRHLVVIGGGYIGLELGSVWHRLGSQVTVVEYADCILPSMDQEIAKNFQRLAAKQGINFIVSSKVLGVTKAVNGLHVKYQSVQGGDTQLLEADKVLVAVGRTPNTKNLGLEKLGVAIDARGRIITDAKFQTSVLGIYAIGDVIAGPMLAHKAEEEGVALAEILCGQAGHVHYGTVPGVVYTHPEIASVGKTEEELKKANIAYKVGKFPMQANSRARAVNQTQGMVKILADASTDKILGVHIIAAEAGTMIHEAVVAMEFSGSAEDLARSFHAHPTLNEAVKEAAWSAFSGQAIHI